MRILWGPFPQRRSLLSVPELLVIGVHHSAPVCPVPPFDTTLEDEGLDVGLAHIVQVVLHPPSAPWPTTTTTP